MVKQPRIEKTFQIPAGQSNYLQFNIDSKDEVILFDIQVEQTPHRIDDIQIYILDEQNYQNYVVYYKAFRAGMQTQHIKWTSYVRAKAFWTPIFFRSNKIGSYYLILDNLHSTITKKTVQVKGTSSSDPPQKLVKSIITAPQQETLSFLHPKILSVSQKLFLNGHYSQAVFEAAKFLETEIKKKSKSKKIGEGLANEVFNENYPILKINKLKTLEETDEQKGFRYLFAGTFVGIKNPRSHSIDELDKSHAMEYLSLINLLFKKLETSKISKIQKNRSKKVVVIDGIGPVTTKKLKEIEIVTVEDLAKSDPNDVSNYTGMEKETAERIIKKAKKMIETS